MHRREAVGRHGPRPFGPRVAREALLGLERRDARRSHRLLGRQARVRQCAADLGDPVHGTARAVVRRKPAIVPSERLAARPGADRARHRREHGTGRTARVTGGVRRGARAAVVARPASRSQHPTQWRPGNRAKSWVAYQKNTFVTPPFPGYTSGHSTYSRAAAETLTAFTGSPFFPGGLGEFVAAQNGYLTTSRPERNRASSGRRITTPQTKPASRGSSAASIPTSTTSAVAGSVRRSARRPGSSPSGTSAARHVRAQQVDARP